MIQTPPTQLVLGVQLRDETNFDNFFVTGANRPLVSSLQGQPAVAQFNYIWGAPSSGKTHLVQALCHDRAEQGLAALYLPLGEAVEQSSDLTPDMLQGANSLSMVCMDDVDAIGGDERWERALFNLYNELLDTDTRLVVTANCAPQQLQLSLPDLQSRLQAASVFQLATPDDVEKREILCLRAANRGMEINEQLGDFLVQRSERSLSGLMSVLDELDRATLERRRRLTIPLIKEVMGW